MVKCQGQVVMFLIDSKRLELRLLEMEDVPALANIWCDPIVMRFCGGPAKQARLPEIIQASRKMFEQYGYAVLAVVRKEDGSLIGVAGCKEDGSDARKPELIYHFAQSSWGQGYAAEAVQAYISWIRENDLADTIHASVMPGNMPSVNVLIRSGFKQKGYVQFEDTGFVDEPYFELCLNNEDERNG